MIDVKLFQPSEYAEALVKGELLDICNGMGAANSLLSSFIPNTMYGLDVEECGDIHDFMYYKGRTIQDKQEADRVFLNNMIRVINAEGGIFAPFRRRRALKYYEAVVYFGGEAFWDGKDNE